ncbi:MAG: gamma-carboxygeranoyl-CoA hydratase [Moraxellaceae bacterium]|nr:MAG: gamma-carboxygeranoyl-CoA hydratase [Moraxellaceae bacterium]
MTNKTLQDIINSSDTEVVTHLDPHGVLRVCINRPTRHNAFNDVVIRQLIHAFVSAKHDDAVRVVILQSEGKNFSSGADLHWMKSMAALDFEENKQDASELARLMHSIFTLPKPVITRIQDASYGGALGLIACSDIAIASQRSQFCLSEVKIGLMPAVISPYVSRAIGARAAQRYFMTAESFDADKALTLGLVHEVVASDDLDKAVDAIASKLLANGPNAVAQAKALAHHVANTPINAELIAYTVEQIANIRVSPEGQEGLSAFLEKRNAHWIKG